MKQNYLASLEIFSFILKLTFLLLSTLVNSFAMIINAFFCLVPFKLFED